MMYIKYTNSDGGCIYLLKDLSSTHNVQFEFNILINISKVNTFEMYFNRNKEYYFEVLKNIQIVNENEISNVLGTNNKDYLNVILLPIKNVDGELLAVIQLNKNYEKNNIDGGLTYKNIDKAGLSLLAFYSSLIFERNILNKNINNLFDSIIVSMINTMEQRDSITCNHSRKVADLIIIFVEAINNTHQGKFKDVFFSETKTMELYYAGLLHDIGKIGIRDNLLLKSQRITKKELDIIKYRFYFVKMNLMFKKTHTTLSKNEEELIKNIDFYYNFIEELNMLIMIKQDTKEQLLKIYNYYFEDIDGIEKSLLTDNELENLIVEYGNLSEEEMEYIKFHTEYSYLILKNIPWSKDYINVPIIARDHHERIDGSGYDRGLKGNEILLETKILSIVDVFEALTSNDRLYKTTSSAEEAIQIMSELVVNNKLDRDLFDIFVNEKIYLHIMQA